MLSFSGKWHVYVPEASDLIRLPLVVVSKMDNNCPTIILLQVLLMGSCCSCGQRGNICDLSIPMSKFIKYVPLVACRRILLALSTRLRCNMLGILGNCLQELPRLLRLHEGSFGSCWPAIWPKILAMYIGRSELYFWFHWRCPGLSGLKGRGSTADCSDRVDGAGIANDECRINVHHS